MCHDSQYIEQLQEDHLVFSERAEHGDETAARAAAETALELQRLGVKLNHPPRFHDAGVDPRVDVVDQHRSRMGFVKT